MALENFLNSFTLTNGDIHLEPLWEWSEKLDSNAKSDKGR